MASVYEDPNRLGRWLQVTPHLGNPAGGGGTREMAMAAHTTSVLDFRSTFPAKLACLEASLSSEPPRRLRRNDLPESQPLRNTELRVQLLLTQGACAVETTEPLPLTPRHLKGLAPSAAGCQGRRGAPGPLGARQSGNPPGTLFCRELRDRHMLAPF